MRKGSDPQRISRRGEIVGNDGGAPVGTPKKEEFVVIQPHRLTDPIVLVEHGGLGRLDIQDAKLNRGFVRLKGVC